MSFLARLPLLLLSSTAVAQVDLAPLFAPPSAAERVVVRSDWETRSPQTAGWTLHATGMLAGRRVDVASHRVDGERHYVLVQWPTGHVSGTPLPILLALHGGIGGVSAQYLVRLNADLPTNQIEDRFLIVLPSFRGEPLDAGPLGQFLSDGTSSQLDFDVDDCIALLDALDREVPDADIKRVAVRGTSRGAGVAALLGVRDPRVDSLVDLFGHTNLMAPEVQLACENIVNTGRLPTNATERRAMNRAVNPYLGGALTLFEARVILLRMSAARFAGRLPAIQIHHGELDAVIPVEQGRHMEAALQALGSSAPPFETFFYPGGSHSVSSLTGQGPRTVAWLAPLAEAPEGFCEAAANFISPHGARIEWTGSTSIANNDLVLHAVDVTPFAFGLFFYGNLQEVAPLGAGVRCVGGSVFRLPVVRASSAGSVSHELDLAQPSTPAGQILVGSTWGFQLFHRDLGAGGPTVNYSDALQVTFGI